MYKVAIFSSDKILVKKISHSIKFLDCNLFKFPALHSNQRAGFLQNFDLIFVQKNQLNLKLNNPIRDISTEHSPAYAVAFFPDDKANLAGPLLDMGYDRCLNELFDEEHLAALVRALLRRRHGSCSTVSFYGDLEFNHATKQSFLKNDILNLPMREAQILDLLLRKVGQIISTEEFLSQIVPQLNGMNKSIIHVCIHRLRQRISFNVLPIRNIKRNGYFLKKYTQPVHLKEANTVFGYLN
jgi:two-component system OmpR family response regulator